MNDEKSFDICIPIVVVLLALALAVWQFYGLVTGGPSTGHSSLELAASPSPPLRTTDPLGD